MRKARNFRTLSHPELVRQYVKTIRSTAKFKIIGELPAHIEMHLAGLKQEFKRRGLRLPTPEELVKHNTE